MISITYTLIYFIFEFIKKPWNWLQPMVIGSLKVHVYLIEGKKKITVGEDIGQILPQLPSLNKHFLSQLSPLSKH